MPAPSRSLADVRKNNWTQTDEDKDLSTIRGIHSTIENITRDLGSASSTLVSRY